jgi:tetratricopeptide (TPR) repeat protein
MPLRLVQKVEIRPQSYHWVGLVIGGLIGLIVLMASSFNSNYLILNTVAIGAIIGCIYGWILGEDINSAIIGGIVGGLFGLHLISLGVFAFGGAYLLPYLHEKGRDWGVFSCPIASVILGLVVVMVMDSYPGGSPMSYTEVFGMVIAFVLLGFIPYFNIILGLCFGAVVGGMLGELTNSIGWLNAPLFVVPLFAFIGYGISKAISISEIREEERIRKQEEQRMREEEEMRRKEKIKREEWEKTTPGLFDTAQRLANEAARIFDDYDYKKSLGKYQEALRNFIDARTGASGLRDEGLVKAIEINIHKVKKSIIACENAIGISLSEEAKKSFDAGNYEEAITTYKKAIAKFRDAVKDAEEIEDSESAERIKRLIKGAEENIENCHIEIDKREVENLFKDSESLHEKAAELARNGEMFGAKGVLRDAETKINSAFLISTERKFYDTANKLNLLLKTIRAEMNVIDEKIAGGISYVDFSSDIAKIRAEGEPVVEISRATEKKEISLTIERTIYDPCKRDFIEGHLPRMKEWINRYDPGAYWFVISIQNNTGKAIEEWGVDLETSSALKIRDAKIEGIEIEIPHEANLKTFIISVPKEYGIVIPKGGAQRVYFKLRAEKPKTTYEISGVFKSEVTGDMLIRPKEFKYLCDAGSLRGAILEHPEAALEYLKTQVNYYSPAEVSAIVKGLDIVFVICRMSTSPYPKRADVRSEVEKLKGYLKNVEDTLGQSYNDFEMLVREMDAVLFEETVPGNYAEKIKRQCLVFPDDLLVKLQSQSIERGG